MSIIKQQILEATRYSGNHEKNKKEISASQIGSEPLEIYNKYKYGIIEADEITQSTIGSILHIGMKTIMDANDDFLTEYSMAMHIYNDWMLTGTADLIDIKNNVIYDYKNIKTFAIDKIKEEGTKNGYVKQLNAYRMLAEHEFNKSFTIKIIAFDKQGGINLRTGQDISSYHEIEIPIIDDKTMQNIIADKLLIVDIAIQNKKEPDKCQDVWLRKIRGRTVPAKCTYYCSYKNVCKHYNPKQETVLASWGF